MHDHISRYLSVSIVVIISYVEMQTLLFKLQTTAIAVKLYIDYRHYNYNEPNLFCAQNRDLFNLSATIPTGVIRSRNSSIQLRRNPVTYFLDWH